MQAIIVATVIRSMVINNYHDNYVNDTCDNETILIMAVITVLVIIWTFGLGEGITTVIVLTKMTLTNRLISETAYGTAYRSHNDNWNIMRMIRE